jgi:5-methylcytosine-specific restriction enzyme subunit McrC
LSTLWVSEYGKIWRGRNNEILPDGDLCLCRQDFRAIRSLLENQEEDDNNFEPIFTYSISGGIDYLKVQNYVGVIRTSGGVNIEILPKLSKNTNPDQARSLLIKMLIELQDSPFREGTSADLEAHRMPLFEILLRYFLDEVANIVRKGIARTYVSHQDNLVFLRGKLKIGEHIKRNSFNAARVFCEYDEYEANRPINRLIKGALEIVSRLATEPINQQRCRELLFWFDRVPPTTNAHLDFQRMQRDRLVQHYAPAMPLCRMILEGLNPLTRHGERKAISLLFPMERVFEDFVAAKLPHQFKDWRVHSQVTGQALVEKHIGKTIFNLRPDLELARGGERLIADTKWKLLNQKDRSNRYGISQGDIYQLFAYSRKFLATQTLREVYLIYPASDSFTEPLPPFWYEEGKDVLFVVPYDLENEELLLPVQSSLNEPRMSIAEY